MKDYSICLMKNIDSLISPIRLKIEFHSIDGALKTDKVLQTKLKKLNPYSNEDPLIILSKMIIFFSA